MLHRAGFQVSTSLGSGSLLRVLAVCASLPFHEVCWERKLLKPRILGPAQGTRSLDIAMLNWI